MPEMQGAGFHDKGLSADPRLVQAQGEIVILQAPADIMLVKAVDALDILAEQGKMTAKNLRFVPPGQASFPQKQVPHELTVRRPEMTPPGPGPQDIQ